MYYCATLVLNSRVLLMYSDMVKELLGYPVQNCPSGSFLSWRGPVGRGGIVHIWYCVNGMPQKETLDNVACTCMLSYPIVVSHYGFNFLCLLLLYSIYLCGWADAKPSLKTPRAGQRWPADRQWFDKGGMVGVSSWIWPRRSERLIGNTDRRTK